MMSDWAVMHTHMRCAPIVTVLIFGLTAAALEADVSSRAGQAPPLPAARMRWYKGNTHTHTLPGDGDSRPDEVALVSRTPVQLSRSIGSQLRDGRRGAQCNPWRGREVPADSRRGSLFTCR